MYKRVKYTFMLLKDECFGLESQWHLKCVWWLRESISILELHKINRSGISTIVLWGDALNNSIKLTGESYVWDEVLYTTRFKE